MVVGVYTDMTMTTDLLTQARAGSNDAFEALTQPHHRELLVHCYRMLGSFHDAEDTLQDTLLSAWQGLSGFEERASLRTWLYRIATHRCLNVLRSARRRPQEWNVPGIEAPEPTQLGEVAWLEPFPDALMDGLYVPPGPEARYELNESVSLAFITAVQALPPRQVAALMLRDVLGFSAKETAAMLDSSVESANSALKRARATLRGQSFTDEPTPTRAQEALVSRFVQAYEAADLPALVALLTDKVFMAMPPISYEYVGSAAVAGFLSNLFVSGPRFELVPTRANGQPAFGLYVRKNGVRIGTGLLVITLSGGKVSAMLRFEKELLPKFGLEPTL